MTRRIPNEGPIPDGVRRRLEPLARMHGVTVDRIVEVVRARRAFKRARSYRRRARKRSLERNPFARKFRLTEQEALLAGEGLLHGHLRAARLTHLEFCELVGISPSTFFRWYGFSLAKWPVEFLKPYAQAQNMAKFLAEKGWDPGKFGPQLPRPMKAGRYPRKSGDLTVVGQPRRIDYSPWKVRR